MGKPRLGVNDVAWIKLFDELDIPSRVKEDGFYKITANQIKTISKREPRLMTKFDHKSTRPAPFKKNKLSILPDTRGTYIIGKFGAYADIDYTPTHPIKKELDEHLESFDINNITSESVALNIAHASGMIDDVMESEDFAQSVLTLSGRMSSTKFDYNIDIGNDSKNKYLLTVTNSQIEIDGSYENLEKVAIIEAKNRVPKDFLVRQLYYPYRMYHNLGLSKQIVPIFFTYADDIFSFHIYEFTDYMNYSSISKTKQMDFVLKQTLDITLQEIDYISDSVEYVDEKITVPQANDFIRVMDMLNYIEVPRSKAETAEFYKFDARQSDYYFNSLKYMGFAHRKNGRYTLTDLGKDVQKLRNSKKRNLIVIQKILEHKPFNEIYKLYGQTGGNVHLDDIVSIFIKYAKPLGDDTRERRAQSAYMWIEWIYSNIEY